MESNIVVRKATVDDAEYLSKHMREADRSEIWASHRHTPNDVVYRCVEQEECLCVEVDSVPAVFFGCVPHDGYAVPWMLATDDIGKIGIRFILGSKDYVLRWIGKYKLLTNYVHAENTVSIRWLKWLGFKIKESVTVNDEQFYRFEMKEGC